MRIGIDRPSDKSQIVPYVLGKFPTEEAPLVKKALDESMILITKHLQAMTEMNLNHYSNTSMELSEETMFNNDMEECKNQTVTTLQSEIISEETTKKDKLDSVENQ